LRPRFEGRQLGAETELGAQSQSFANGPSGSTNNASIGFSEKYGLKAQPGHGVKATEDRFGGADPNQQSSVDRIAGIKPKPDQI